MHSEVAGPAIRHDIVVSDDVDVIVFWRSICYQGQNVLGEGSIPVWVSSFSQLAALPSSASLSNQSSPPRLDSQLASTVLSLSGLASRSSGVSCAMTIYQPIMTRVYPLGSSRTMRGHRPWSIVDSSFQASCLWAILRAQPWQE